MDCRGKKWAAKAFAFAAARPWVVFEGGAVMRLNVAGADKARWEMVRPVSDAPPGLGTLLARFPRVSSACSDYTPGLFSVLPPGAKAA